MSANYGPPEGWKSVVPAKGTLSFDYVSRMLPSPGVAAISDDQLVGFLKEEVAGGYGLGFGFEACGLPERGGSWGEFRPDNSMLVGPERGGRWRVVHPNTSMHMLQ